MLIDMIHPDLEDLRRRITAIRSEMELLSARLVDMPDFRDQEFRDDVARLGALAFELRRLQDREKRLRGEPV